MEEPDADKQCELLGATLYSQEYDVSANEFWRGDSFGDWSDCRSEWGQSCNQSSDGCNMLVT